MSRIEIITSKVLASLVFLLTLSVCLPLIVLTIQTKGWSWGFGMAGLPLLLPLCGYVFFAFIPFIGSESKKFNVFLLAHVVVLALGLGSAIAYPLYPRIIMLPPLLLFIISLFDRKRYRLYTIVCFALTLTLNILFLHWEFQFGRTIPVIQLFEQPKETPEF